MPPACGNDPAATILWPGSCSLVRFQGAVHLPKTTTCPKQPLAQNNHCAKTPSAAERLNGYSCMSSLDRAGATFGSANRLSVRTRTAAVRLLRPPEGLLGDETCTQTGRFYLVFCVLWRLDMNSGARLAAETSNWLNHTRGCIQLAC